MKSAHVYYVHSVYPFGTNCTYVNVGSVNVVTLVVAVAIGLKNNAVVVV